MDRFDEEGPEGLFGRDREGRPRKIDEEVEAVIEELLQTDPTEEALQLPRRKKARRRGPAPRQPLAVPTLLASAGRWSL